MGPTALLSVSPPIVALATTRVLVTALSSACLDGATPVKTAAYVSPYDMMSVWGDTSMRGYIVIAKHCCCHTFIHTHAHICNPTLPRRNHSVMQKDYQYWFTCHWSRICWCSTFSCSLTSTISSWGASRNVLWPPITLLHEQLRAIYTLCLFRGHASTV